MGSVKTPKDIATECRRRASEVKSQGDREQLIQISRRLSGEQPDKQAGPSISPEDSTTPH